VQFKIKISCLFCAVEAIPDAPGVKFVMRSLVQARGVDDVIRMSKNHPYGVGYGYTINVSTKDGIMTSVEVGPGKPDSKVHVYDVTHQGQEPDSPLCYYHFNCYKHLNKTVSSFL
jgi:hypothetical protein